MGQLNMNAIARCIEDTIDSSVQDPRTPAAFRREGVAFKRMDSPLYRAALAAVARERPLRTFLEIGVKQGGGLAVALRSAPQLERIVLCDFWTINEKKRRERQLVQAVIAESGFQGQVEFIDGSSLVTLPTLTGPFDLVGVDGSHRWKVAREDIGTGFRLLSVGGYLVVDDLVLHERAIATVVQQFVEARAECADAVYVNTHDWPGVAVIKKRTEREPSESEFFEVLESAARGKSGVGELYVLARSLQDRTNLVAKELNRVYCSQDWDRVEVLLGLALRYPARAYEPILGEIRDRRCLEIDQALLHEAIRACGVSEGP